MALPIKIELGLLFGECNGFMNLAVYNQHELLVELNNVKDSKQTLVLDVIFPAKLVFVIANKDMLTDTKVSDTGEIIADKFVQLTKLHVGYCPVAASKLRDICLFEPENNGVIYDNYWYTNGKATIEFKDKSFTKWHLNLMQNKK